MYKSRLIFSFISCGLFIAGFLFSFWPLDLMGLLLAAVTGRFGVAVCIGFAMDAAYGKPTGLLHAAHVPFTLLALGLSFLQLYLSSYFRESNSGLL